MAGSNASSRGAQISVCGHVGILRCGVMLFYLAARARSLVGPNKATAHGRTGQARWASLRSRQGQSSAPAISSSRLPVLHRYCCSCMKSLQPKGEPIPVCAGCRCGQEPCGERLHPRTCTTLFCIQPCGVGNQLDIRSVPSSCGSGSTNVKYCKLVTDPSLVWKATVKT